MAKDNEKRGFLVYATLEEQLAFLTDEQVGQLFRAMFMTIPFRCAPRHKKA